MLHGTPHDWSRSAEVSPFSWILSTPWRAHLSVGLPNIVSLQNAESRSGSTGIRTVGHTSSIYCRSRRRASSEQTIETTHSLPYCGNTTRFSGRDSLTSLQWRWRWKYSHRPCGEQRTSTHTRSCAEVTKLYPRRLHHDSMENSGVRVMIDYPGLGRTKTQFHLLWEMSKKRPRCRFSGQKAKAGHCAAAFYSKVLSMMGILETP